MLSKYCSHIAKKYGIKVGGINKLVPNLGNKSKYVNVKCKCEICKYEIFSYIYLMKLTKIHKVFKFKHSDWLKSYIDFNTEKRKKALLI